MPNQLDLQASVLPTTRDFLDMIGQRSGNSTTYNIAKILRTRSQTVTHWRKEGVAMGGRYAMRAAEYLDLDPAYVLACVEHERAASEPRPAHQEPEVVALWQRIAEHFASKAASILLVGALFIAGAFSSGNSAVAATTAHVCEFTPVYIMRAWRRMLRRLGLLSFALALGGCASVPPLIPVMPQCSSAYVVHCPRDPERIGPVELPRQCAWDCAP